MAQPSLAIELDQLISSSFFYLDKWTPDEKLKSNAAFDVLRYLLCRLHDEGDGKVLQGHIELSQGYIGQKLGLSRQWVNTLVSRLVDAGWLVASSTWTGEKMRSSTCFSAGRSLRRLVCQLLGSRRKKRQNTPVNGRRQFSPRSLRSREKRQDFAFQEEAEEQARSFATQSGGIAQELATRFLQLGQEVEQPSTDHLAESVPLSSQEGHELASLMQAATGKARELAERFLRLGQR